MSGTLGFRYFPSQTWRPSGTNIEFDASQANTATQNQRTLLIGQITASGTTPANVQVQAYSQAQVNGLCGANSMLANMYAAYRLQDPFGECWLGPMLDNAGGSAATGTVTITGTATAAGTLALYLMGTSVPVAVSNSDTPTIIASNIAAAIAAVGTFPFTAAASVGVVTLTAVHKGVALNDIDLRVNYIGAQNNEVLPAGITVAFSNPVSGSTAGTLAGGATNPTLTTLTSNLGVQLFDFIACPYNDATSLNALETFLSDQTGRWSAELMQYGHVFYAYRGTVAARGTFGLGRNNQHESVIGYFDSPTPAWLESADWCGAHAIRFKVNPAQGISSQRLNMLAPPLNNQDTPGSRNTLLFDGVSTFNVDAAGICRIDRSITSYTTNASGQPDNSYLNTNIMFQAMYAARYISTQITTQFIDSGKILVSNGTPIPPGAPAVTPNLILGSVIGIYAYLCSIFIVQNPQIFAANATAQTGAKGQVLLYLPIDFSDQVVNVGVLVQFRQST
ncbi:MAG TPA: phage tail sheath subtilisin-like domain-containing protein [Chloroflexota bacterium]|jgi:phage tail sheath gpL-like